MPICKKRQHLCVENPCVEMKAGFCEEFSGICCTVTTKRTKEMKEPLRVLIIVFHLVPQSLWFPIRLLEQKPLRPDLYHSVCFFGGKRAQKFTMSESVLEPLSIRFPLKDESWGQAEVKLWAIKQSNRPNSIQWVCLKHAWIWNMSPSGIEPVLLCAWIE